MSKSAQINCVYTDFEFNQITEENVNLVSCVTHDPHSGETKKFWLHNSPKEQAKLFKHFLQYELVIGFQCVAEARSFLSLNLDPLKFQWIDLYLEYRMLTNHNDRLQWGKQLVDGKVKTFSKPKSKWEREEGEKEAGFKATHSLAEATYKLTGLIRDTKEKDEVRQLIISNPKSFTAEQRERILNYNAEDVVFLKTIWESVKKEFKIFCENSIPLNRYFSEAMLRGRYAAHTAIMESTGYPINVEATRNFSRQIPAILAECQRDINSQFPDMRPFQWKRAKNVFSWNQKISREWLTRNVEVKKWMKTDKGQLSLSLEAWERFFPFKHDYPRGNFAAQIVRFLKLKQSLYGFSDTGGKRKNFWDSVGSDGRVRPYMNIYGAQSGRSQPAASGFMFLKPAWMRSLVEPSRGKFIAGVDYGQQEFFLSGLESGDMNMINAYLSGDPYLYGAKLAGVIPQDGKKEDYKVIRDIFKNTYLGILFGMTKFGLSKKLTGDTGRPWTEDEAQEQIDTFEETFSDYIDWRKSELISYQEGNGIILPCIGEDSPIMTRSGFKNIQDINITDLLWDGIEWVSHGGIVQRGEKVVTTGSQEDITSTMDHLFLVGRVWRTHGELVVSGEYQKLRQEKFLDYGSLLDKRKELNREGISYVAAAVALRQRIESIHCDMGLLRPVLDALNLEEPKTKDPTIMTTFLMTSIFLKNGSKLTGMPGDGVSSRMEKTAEGILIEVSSSNSSPLNSSLNILLAWMGLKIGNQPWIELITTGITSLETYDLLLKKLTTRTARVYDILNCGPRNRFQVGDLIAHNCGWMVGPDNDNPRSALNVPIQGFGSSIMRKAVDLAVEEDCRVIFTLHDAIYIEGNVGEEKKVVDLMDSMREAFQFYYLDTPLYETAGKIKLDPFIWGPTYEKDSEIKVGDISIPCSDLYRDERALNEYERFKSFFEDPDTDLL